MADLEIVRGDSAEYDIDVRDANGVINITGMSLRFTAKTDPTAADPGTITKTIGSGIVVTNATLGKARISFLPGDTSAMPLTNPTSRGELFCAPLHWDLQLTDGLNNVYTVAKGKLIIRGDISRTTP